MSDDKSLKMSFDPRTIEHLGVKMYSQIPNAIAELVANSYDADAQKVFINLFDDGEDKSIEVADDGVGMSFKEINSRFLRIGRKRRKEDGRRSPSGKRKVTGRKGLGKLAFFGLGNIIEIETTKAGLKKKVVFVLKWEDIINSNEEDYKPEYREIKCNVDTHGTKITLKKLKRKSPLNKDYKETLANSLARLFNLFDTNFKVHITFNGDDPIIVDNTLRYRNIDSEFRWTFPEFCLNVNHDYSNQKQIEGEIISTEKPISPNLRGITLFSNGRLINTPEFFGVSESSHGFSYFTGWLEVDFIDDWEEDVISTDRKSINWDLPRTEKLREFLKKTMSEIERKWRAKRKEKSEKEIEEKTQIKLSDWYKNLPEEIRPDIQSVVNTLRDKEELDVDIKSNVVKKVHSLVPEYPYYHWRHLHETVKNASKENYKDSNYYGAFTETVKRYINQVRNLSENKNRSEASMMGEVFGKNGATLSVSDEYKKKDGSDFQATTKDNIEEGQKFLSMGIVSGGRNPVSHEEIVELRDSGLFSEKDCLDALSLMSHLFRRLNDATKNSD